MKVIIAGTRQGIRLADIVDAIHAAEKHGIVITQLWHGNCRGVDQDAEWVCSWILDFPVTVVRCEADWERYGKSAGPIRNSQMASKVDALILIWDGKSPGSDNMLSHAKASGLKIYQHIVNNE